MQRKLYSTYFSSGAYDGVADLLFDEENVDAYFLEYDDHRSGGFAPLKKISGDKKSLFQVLLQQRNLIQKIKNLLKEESMKQLNIFHQNVYI